MSRGRSPRTGPPTPPGGFGTAASILVLVVLTLLWAARPAAAHEGAGLRAVVEIRAAQEFAVYVVVDRRHLPPEFGRSAPPTDIADVPEGEAALREARGLVAGLDVLFDGAPAPHRAAWVAPRVPTDVQLRLTGAIPAGARAVALRNGLHLGGWMASVRHEGRGDDTSIVLADAEAMPPVAVNPATDPPGGFAVATGFLREGFRHILPRGLDHILFVLGLVLGTRRAKPLLLEVTAFTVAHTLTLALATLGLVRLPGAVVEPLIAGSIAYVAIENLRVRRISGARLAPVFVFGLLHGLGFAGALADLGLPPVRKALALVSFNVGVELGQLAVLAAAWTGLSLPFGDRSWYRAAVVVPGSVAIACIGACWAATRTLGG